MKRQFFISNYYDKSKSSSLSSPPAVEARPLAIVNSWVCRSALLSSQVNLSWCQAKILALLADALVYTRCLLSAAKCIIFGPPISRFLKKVGCKKFRSISKPSNFLICNLNKKERFSVAIMHTISSWTNLLHSWISKGPFYSNGRC